MRRILLCVSYDGTNYHGWQLQPGKPTIEGIINAHLHRLLKEEINVIGASRTDAGVHAHCAVCVFDTNSRIPADKFSYALNVSLPEDIRIIKSLEVPLDFHPRKTPSKKTYEYHIWNDEFVNPLNRLYTHHVYNTLDISKMNLAASYLVGEHDFKSFSSIHTQALTSERIIYEAEVFRNSQKEIVISITGNGFLYNMVRIIAGTLIEVGLSKRDPEEIIEIIKSLDRSKAGPTAPAHGLVLKKYVFNEYPEIEL